MKKKLCMRIMLAICFTFLVAGCGSHIHPKTAESNPSKLHTASAGKTKPVILVIVDSLMEKPLREAIRQKSAPAMEFLLQKGELIPQVVSSFPTMSVTIDSTLLTGTYADGHHVPGLVWYDGKEQRMVFYGNGIKEAMKIDQVQVFMDAVYHLNQEHLSKETKTIHEELADQGKDTASINGVIYRGRTEHVLKVPPFLKLAKDVPDQLRITGPKLFSYAALARLDPDNARNTYLWKKFGMNDRFTAQDLAYLVRQHRLPAVTVAYFPENDNRVHRKGPDERQGIIRADEALQEALSSFGSWERAAKEAIWIVMGDSGQSRVYGDRGQATIELIPLLKDFRIARLNRPVSSGDQILISTNERMAYVYALDPRVKVSEVAARLSREPKLDMIAFKEGSAIRIISGKSGGTLRFRPGGSYKDEYGQTWTLSGDPRIADMKITGNRIVYGKYPDALARLQGAMFSHEGRYVVANAEPGYELVGESSLTHVGGGSHGSLHEKDSLVPVIVAGTDIRPKTLRIVDFKDWIMQLADERR